ncbi:hypothetical protein CsatB_019011 [Cannabis sativa]
MKKFESSLGKSGWNRNCQTLSKSRRYCNLYCWKGSSVPTKCCCRQPTVD